MARKPLCVATQHDLRKTLPRSSIKSFCATFFKKWQIPPCNFLQTISFFTNNVSIRKVANHRFSLSALRQQMTDVSQARKGTPMLKWRENRYVLQRNTICAEFCCEALLKSFLVLFLEKEQKPLFLVTFSKSSKTLSL